MKADAPDRVDRAAVRASLVSLMVWFSNCRASVASWLFVDTVCRVNKNGKEQGGSSMRDELSNCAPVGRREARSYSS